MANDSWKERLWAFLAAAADEKGQPFRLRVQYYNHPEIAFTMEVTNDKLRARVDDEMLTQLAKIDRKALLERLQDDQQREMWRRQAAQIESLRGKTVGLYTAISTIGVPLGSPNRATINVNPYYSVQVQLPSLQAILRANDYARVAARSKPPTLTALAKLLGIVTEGEDLSEPLRELQGLARSIEMPAPVSDVAASIAEEIGNAEPEIEEDGPWSQHNLIFFGPPGTGKSFRVGELVTKHLDAKDENTFRVTFHPEYTYFDFVGQYRPAVGWLPGGADFRLEGEERGRREEPRVYFDFEPGPLSLALAAAANSPSDEAVVLIIEEINRGNCAAIFGDVFQLLDRKTNFMDPKGFGWSEYDIRPSREWGAWLTKKVKPGAPAWRGGKLRLPPNLFLYATMNTSDQSLFPMDTAFRRRWSMVYEGVTPKETLATEVPIRPGEFVPWRELMLPLNERIVAHTGSDDKQMGPYFVKATTKDHRVSDVEFQSKVLFYLWSDVFRDQPEQLFAEGIRTYDQLVAAHRVGKAVFRKEIHDGFKPAPVPAAPATEIASGG